MILEGSVEEMAFEVELEVLVAGPPMDFCYRVVQSWWEQQDQYGAVRRYLACLGDCRSDINKADILRSRVTGN